MLILLGINMLFLYFIITFFIGGYLGTIWIAWVIRNKLNNEQFNQLKTWMGK